MRLILPQRLTRQPQGATPRIDQGNPLARGLIAAYSFDGAGNVYNAVTGKSLAPTAVTNAKFRTTGYMGVGISSTSSNGSMSINDVSLPPPGSGVEATVAYGAYFQLANASYEFIARPKGQNIKIGQSVSGFGQIGISVAGVADVGSGISRPSIGEHHVVHAIKHGGTMDTVVVSPAWTRTSTVSFPTPLANTLDTDFLSAGTEGGPSGAILYYFFEWNRKLTLAEARSVAANPWQLFQAPARQILLGDTATVPPTGTLASTLGGATLAASGAAINAGPLAATLDGCSMAASGTVAPNPSGALASTLDGFTMAATGAILIPGTFASTLAGVSMSAAGAVSQNAAGTFASTLDGVSMAAIESVTTEQATKRRRILRRDFN